ncbi:hypothetical protein LSCM1_03461 [Leishmania martiniquensis]|uniref:Uncharacterized protein n=1 Tax=Leishmania martiniquensis TaxID=1580590 RepID=A0A836HEL9_9TRYP|nr:hypothetical protein LSCM1_03461 [Leishmania martiniquensis]
MYSDSELEASSCSYRSLQRQAPKRTKGRTHKKPEADCGAHDDFVRSAPGLLGRHSGGGAAWTQGTSSDAYCVPVGESSLPVECLERCAVLIDCAMFDPTRPKGDINERVVECSMRVVQYPFEEPEHEATETILYLAEVSASNMAKLTRAQTAQRWRHLIESHHGIPCVTRGMSAGFDDLRKTTRTFRVYMDEYCHTLLDNKKSAGDLSRVTAKAREGPCGVSTYTAEKRVMVARAEAELLSFIRGMLSRVIEAATRTCQSEDMKRCVAFLTTKRQYKEVCCALLWLQKKAKVPLPPYQVFTIASALGEDWEELVVGEQAHFCCGYHSYLMTNEYGNFRHCCESTVSATANAIDTAVRQLHRS